METFLVAAFEAVSEAFKAKGEDCRRARENESEKLRQKIAQAIIEFGPHLIASWSPEDSPVFEQFDTDSSLSADSDSTKQQAIRLVYVGDFDYYRYGADNEPERVYAGQKQRSVLYLGADSQLYIYEAYGDDSTRSIGMRRLNLENEELWRLRQFHELLARIGLL